MKQFKDKVVVITGAGSGMGRAYAMAFGQLGAKLALNDFDAKGLNDTLALLQAQGRTTVVSRAFDVSNKEAMYAFASHVQQQLGNAHVIINNAGIEGSTQPTWQTDERDYERVMQINFFGVLYGTKAFLPQLLANNEGAVVNISSVFGLVGTPNSSDYCASKFAVRGFTESLMVELEQSPVSVHLVHPGGIATHIARKASGQAFAKHYLKTSPDAIAQHVIRAIGQKKVKIVFGHGALKTWLGATLLPLRWFNFLAWHELKHTIDLAAYKVLSKRS